MENFNSIPVVADDLESWLESTQYCENCQKLSKTIKNRETVLKKLKSRIISTDKIIKQFHLKKNELSQTRQQLVCMTEKFKKSEKISQTLQSNVASLLKRNPSDQTKNQFEKKLAEKDLTIKNLQERLKFTESEHKLFKQSSETSFTQTEKLRDEIKRQSKLIQSLETNQKRKTLQLEKFKKEIEENKSSLSEMKKLVKSLEKELSQFKEKKEKYFQILLDNGLLPKKDIQAENRKKNTQLCNIISSVGIMSDEDDVRPKEKKKIPQLIDINSIMEEFRAVPRMLSPLPFYEGELDSSLDSSEKSVNDLAKLLELEFLQSSNLSNQESDENLTKAVSSKTKFVNPVNSSTNSDLTISSTSSLFSSLLKSDSKKNSLANTSTKQTLTVVGLTNIGHLSSDSDEEEKIQSPFKLNSSAPILPKNRSSDCQYQTEFTAINKMSSDFVQKDEFKISSQLTHPQLESSSDCSFNSFSKEPLQKSLKLCNSVSPCINKSSIFPLSEDKVCKVNGNSSGNSVTTVLDKQDQDSNFKPDSLKASKESVNSLDESKAARNNLDSVEQVINSEKLLIHNQMTSFKSDMVNLFGSEYLSSSSDSDEEKTIEQPTYMDKIKSLTSAETNHKDISPKGKMTENFPSIDTDSKNPTSIINGKSDKSTSFPKEQFSKVNFSLNNEVVEKTSASKLSTFLVKQDHLNNSGDFKTDPCAFPKILQTDLKNTAETNSCFEHAKNSDHTPDKVLPSSSESCIISQETDQTTFKEFCLFDLSLDNNVKTADVQDSPEISYSKSGLPETEDSTESVRNLIYSPEKASIITDLQENRESNVDNENHSRTRNNSSTDTLELMVTDSRENSKKMPLNSLSESSLKVKPCLESTKSCGIDKEILEVAMTRNLNSFEGNQNLASLKEKAPNEFSDKNRSLVQDHLIKKSVKLPRINELLTSLSEKTQFNNEGNNENKTLHQSKEFLKGSYKDIVSADVYSSSTEEPQIKTKKESELLEFSENGQDTKNLSHLLPTPINAKKISVNRAEIQNKSTENCSELNISSDIKNVENCCILATSDLNPCLEITSSKEVAVNSFSSNAPSTDEIELEISDSIYCNQRTHFGDSFQASFVSTSFQITSQSGDDESADVSKRSDKLNSYLENKYIAKKPSVLTEADINKVDQPPSLTLLSEKVYPEPDTIFDTADSFLSLSSHGIINCSSSSDKENEVKDISDKSIPSETKFKKSSKTESVLNSDEELHFFQCNSKEIEDCEYVKNDKKFNSLNSFSESSKDAESLTNSTENIPKRLSDGSSSFSESGNSELLKDSSKENGENIWNFNKLPQNTRIPESSKKLEEIGSKLSSSSSLSETIKDSETLRNDLENSKKHKLIEDTEKFSNITNIVENSKGLGIGFHLSEISASLDSENLKNFVDDKKIQNINHLSERCMESRSLRNGIEENDKKYENFGKSESSKNNIEEENGKELGIEASENLENDMKEITENVYNSNGICKDTENLDHPSKKGMKSTNNELQFMGVNLESKDISNVTENKESNDLVDGCDNIVTRDDNATFSHENDNIEGTYSLSGDLSSVEKFTDFDSTGLVPMGSMKLVSHANINDLFGDDDDSLNPRFAEIVTDTEPKNPTSCLSNNSVSRINNCNHSVGDKIQVSVPLVVNKVRTKKNNLASILDNTKKQNESSFSKFQKKRHTFKMATVVPIKSTKLNKKSVDSDELCQMKTEDAVINSKKSFIKFVASSEKFLPSQVDPAFHDNSFPSKKEEKKDEISVELTSKSSDSIFQNHLPSSKIVNDFPEKTDYLQLQTGTFNEQLFARKSKRNNSENIGELIKEFILVTRPISPLSMTPEKSASQFHNNSSPPYKKQINLNTSIPISSPSDCDYLQDIRSILNMVPQISPIVTPKKLQEKRSKKCLLKEFVSDDGTESATVDVTRPFPKTTDIDSGNAENKTSLLLNSDSLNTYQSKLIVAAAAAKTNHVMQVNISQSDKKCLNFQQRLLRKTRSLHHICLPPVTKSDKKKKTKSLEPKDISKTTANTKLLASSSNPQKINISLEKTLTQTVEELKAPKKELMNSAEPEKLSSFVDSVDRKKSVRKRKMDITESLGDKLPEEKKQCNKNNAILSRAWTSVMKVADREFQTYWKYASSPPGQVLQKLLQTNREAGLIVEIVVMQAVKLLSSTTDNMLPWYITKCKSNAPTPYFSDKEKHLMRLLCLFKQKKDMDHIFAKFRKCLKDALTKQDWNSTSLGKWSLCRMYIAMCRLEGLLSEVRVFFYTSFCHLPCDQYITFAVITACTWPLVLSYERIDGYVSLFRVIEYTVIKSVNEKPHNKKYLECLVKHCKWKPSGNNKNNDIQRSLFNHLHDCIEAGATKDEIFSYVKGVELLSLQEKWLWTTSLLRSRISQLLKKCLQIKPPEDRQSEFNCLLCHVFQMLGNLCMKYKKRDKTITFVINSLLKPFLISNKFSSDVHLCCTRILMKLYPFEPCIVYPMLESWFEENIMWEPSSKLMTQWILLKNQLNKEIGVT